MCWQYQKSGIDFCINMCQNCGITSAIINSGPPFENKTQNIDIGLVFAKSNVHKWSYKIYSKC